MQPMRMEKCDSLEAVASDLTILVFFFAMHSCKFVSVPIPGRTKLLSVCSLQFCVLWMADLAETTTVLGNVWFQES